MENVDPETIAALVSEYDHLSVAQRRRFHETDVRTNFIDRLFSALGWNMHDRGEVERETIVEDSKRPDYIFKISGVPYFYLEAKRFSEDVRSPDWAADAITKAYNRGVGWAGVTNFTDLVVYDAYEKVGAAQRPRATLDLHYDRYADSGSPIWELSPQSLRAKSLDRRAQETGARRRAIPIERRLYESMREWRERLINSMAQYLGYRSERQFQAADEAVQKLLDRLTFLRHCEDRCRRVPLVNSTTLPRGRDGTSYGHNHLPARFVQRERYVQPFVCVNPDGDHLPSSK